MESPDFALIDSLSNLCAKRTGNVFAPRTGLNAVIIGAHAELVRWKLATRDVKRYRIYFPELELILPATVL